MRKGGEQLFAYTRDVSPDSMGISCKFEIQPDETVLVRLAYEDASIWSEAKVIHCTKATSGFNIGVKMRK